MLIDFPGLFAFLWGWCNIVFVAGCVRVGWFWVADWFAGVCGFPGGLWWLLGSYVAGFCFPRFRFDLVFRGTDSSGRFGCFSVWVWWSLWVLGWVASWGRWVF